MSKHLRITLLSLLCLNFQQQTSGLFQQSVVIFPLGVLPMVLSVMAHGCWCLVEWWSMESTAMIYMSFR